MKVNLDSDSQEWEHYKVYQNEEAIISSYIQENQEQDYENIIKQDSSIETLLALSDIRKNLINWYPFKEGCSILEIGAGIGEITGELCKKAKKVIALEPSKRRAEAIAKRHGKEENLEIIVQNFNQIQIEEKFDYVTLFGTLELVEQFENREETAKELFHQIKGLLKADGILLLAMDNELAINQFSSIEKERKKAQKILYSK